MKKVINFIFVICLILLGIFLLNRPHLSNGFYMGSSKQSEMMLNHKLRGHINNKKSFELFDGKYKETFNLIE